MFNALVVVWRESLEAILVVGILLAWISRQPEPKWLKRGVWLGIAAGVLMAMLLGGVTFLAQSQLAGQALEVFQLSMLLFSVGLLFQMVRWMRHHGHQMKQQLESHIEQRNGVLGVALITALAVAREGAETVIFIYGLGLQAEGKQLATLVLASLSGFLLAAATAWIVARGARFVNYRTLFRVSEAMLLLIAGALLASAVDRMIALDWLPTLIDPLWDSSSWLSDSQGIGNLLANFIGYRAQPSGILLVIMLSYWLFVWRCFKREVQHAA